MDSVEIVGGHEQAGDGQKGRAPGIAVAAALRSRLPPLRRVTRLPPALTGPEGMWDEEDGFYYDVLRLPDGNARRLKLRSMVGLLPLCATTIIEPWQRERVPRVLNTLRERRQRRPELNESMHATGPGHFGYGDWLR